MIYYHVCTHRCVCCGPCRPARAGVLLNVCVTWSAASVPMSRPALPGMARSTDLVNKDLYLFWMVQGGHLRGAAITRASSVA